jgi:DNA-binding Lrp family transcriptional regulator
MLDDIITRLKLIDNLIIKRNTGKPAELARRLNISERSLYDHIKLMRKLGAPIEFSLYLDSYQYSRGGSFIIRFVDELRNEINDLPLVNKVQENRKARRIRKCQQF